MKMKFESAYKRNFESLPDPQQWMDWGWQLRHSLKSQEDFAKYFNLSESEKIGFGEGEKIFNIRTTPYYASLADKDNSNDPLRLIMMPNQNELYLDQHLGGQHLLDPLAEKKNNPAPRVIHRYPDRVLFLVTDVCSVYCRYCTRKHFTGGDQAFIKSEEFEKAIAYIQSKRGIREVILSGGDPLTLSDNQLEKILSRLREIDHIEIIRIGSRMPVVCPMRITDTLVKIIQKYHPVYLMTHFNHPRELTAESAEALTKVVNHGIPTFNQMVLLRGVNNHPAIVQALSRRLLYLRVKPYYMFQCDPSEGTDHLRTSIEESMQIQRELWGNLSGLAMPTLSLDIPNGGGKTYLVPNFEVEKTDKYRRYKGWDGVEAEYKEPQISITDAIQPIDVELYLNEWNELQKAKM